MMRFILMLFFMLAHSHEWVAHLAPGVDPHVWTAQHGFEYVRALGFLPDHYVVRDQHGKARSARDVERIRRSEGTVWVEEQVKRPRMSPRSERLRVSRTPNVPALIPDPLYQQQWHLHNHLWSVDVPDTPGTTATGANVTIAIVDDGLEYTHPDLRPNYDAEHSWNYNDDNANPMPTDSDQAHGTAAAGVAAAAAWNGHCGRGAAPKARLLGVRTIADGVTDLVEAQALTHHAVGVTDIYSCSWGPADDGRLMAEPGYLVRQALALYAGQLRGRLGKGSVYVWAAGNGRGEGDSCAFDGYASSPFVIAIGALDYNGDQSWYSESCAALMAVTPSNGASGHGITTVDRMGDAGYDPSECTDAFGGTSSATPLAAGLIALALQARPELTWRDVKHIVAKAAVPVHLEDGSWSRANGRGYRHSSNYGFGILRAPRLLATANNHTLVPPAFKIFQSGTVLLHHPAGYIPYTFVYNVSAADAARTNITFIEHVLLRVTLQHEVRGHLRITVQSPEGAVSEMAPERPQDDNFDYPPDGWRFMSVHHWGERRVEGAWTITVDDQHPDTRGKYHWNSFQLDVMGY